MRVVAQIAHRALTSVQSGFECPGRSSGNKCVSPVKVIAGHFVYSRASACV